MIKNLTEIIVNSNSVRYRQNIKELKQYEKSFNKLQKVILNKIKKNRDSLHIKFVVKCSEYSVLLDGNKLNEEVIESISEIVNHLLEHKYKTDYAVKIETGLISGGKLIIYMELVDRKQIEKETV